MSKEFCPICQKETAFNFRPFCSSRCKLIDLQKWLSGTYAIPGEEAPEDDSFKKNEETL